MYAGYDQNTGSMELGALVRISDCVFRNNSVESEPVGVTMDTDRSGFSDENDTIVEPDVPPNQRPNGDGNNNDDNNNKNDPGKPLLDPSERFDSRGQLFRNHILRGRGGGVALIINADSAAEVEVFGCEFVENVAVEYGGGLYLLLQGPTSHQVAITRSR